MASLHPRGNGPYDVESQLQYSRCPEGSAVWTRGEFGSTDEIVAPLLRQKAKKYKTKQIHGTYSFDRPATKLLRCILPGQMGLHQSLCP